MQLLLISSITFDQMMENQRRNQRRKQRKISACSGISWKLEHCCFFPTFVVILEIKRQLALLSLYTKVSKNPGPRKKYILCTQPEI